VKPESIYPVRNSIAQLVAYRKYQQGVLEDLNTFQIGFRYLSDRMWITFANRIRHVPELHQTKIKYGVGKSGARKLEVWGPKSMESSIFELCNLHKLAA
jgi:hypothetical protein